MIPWPGGCGPFGLSVAGREAGQGAEIFVSTEGALFLQFVRTAERQWVVELALADFRAYAKIRHLGDLSSVRARRHKG